MLGVNSSGQERKNKLSCCPDGQYPIIFEGYLTVRRNETMKTTSIFIFVALFLAACSPSPISSYHHPATLEEVMRDGRFRKVFTSDSGITFYVRKLDEAESQKLSNDKLAADFVLSGETPMLYVAVQADGKVLQKPAPLDDLAGFGMNLSQQLSAEPDGAANGSQPTRSETNRTSSAAGSRR
jgi:acyl-CoA synthetase (AMP-forming)/AMP-acid ligase II